MFPVGTRRKLVKMHSKADYTRSGSKGQFTENFQTTQTLVYITAILKQTFGGSCWTMLPSTVIDKKLGFAPGQLAR